MIFLPEIWSPLLNNTAVTAANPHASIATNVAFLSITVEAIMFVQVGRQRTYCSRDVARYFFVLSCLAALLSSAFVDLGILPAG